MRKQTGKTVAAVRQPATGKVPEFVPRTELARDLWEMRKRIVATGVPPLDDDELAREIAKGRAEFADERLLTTWADPVRVQ